MIELSFSLSELEFFLLIVVRLTCFILVAPFFSINGVPARFKVAFGIFVSIVIYQFVTPDSFVDYSSPWGYAVIVLKEAVVGLLIGLGANISFSIISFAGRIIDMEMGLSMASVMDPSTRENTTVTGVMLNYLITLILISTGMHRYLIQAITETYQLIPVNGAAFNLSGLLNAWVSFMLDFFSIGFRICMPVMASIMILNGILAILARVSPQLNMFAVGLQLKILVGLSVLLITIGVLPYISEYIYREMKVMIVAFVEAMM